MTRDEILKQLAKGKGKGGIDVAEAATLLAALEPTVVKIVGTEFGNAAEFLKVAQPVKLSDGNGLTVTLEPKVFSTGSYGWSANGKLAVGVGSDKTARVQGSINLVVIGSKPMAA